MCVMHGSSRAGEDHRNRAGWHMWTVPTRASVAADGSTSSSSSNSALSFDKDGRKISVGDCALFKPPQDSPPFIGIIRSLTTSKENKLTLSVNWLYRPAEVKLKLGKGILLEAAPNEVFYSFHKDEIPAASLLHPCKVAFLPKGVELPSGICSFVCRQVYDIKSKCLWWLTDQDYINELQVEVDQLLYKTRIEMHATLQPGGHSPKPMNGPTSQLKPGSDSVQNSASSFPSQVKGKKRERGDQGSEPVKRERLTRMDDGDSGHGKPENILRSEVAKITEKGALVDFEGVEKLIKLMMPDRNEKKIDLVCRSMLAGVVAATEKFDCRSRFVQLRGLPVLDEWLQEVHKGKIGDGSISKDSDKSIEEFLLVSLRALDKLPVNLNALQMCNIGKSVNHLRTHKNLEIQKKARSLVDKWKRHVEAEMDAKSGSSQSVSWSARSRIPEVSHCGNRNSGGSSDVAMKSSAMQLSASKAASVKVVQGETASKSASASGSPGSVKSAPSPAAGSTNLKDGQPRNASVGGVSDLPSTPARDEKSSSSSQSHNNSQSCSTDHAKTGGFSGKEDARSSTAGSMTVNKISGSSSRPRKSTNGFSGPAASGVQREYGSSRNSSVHRNPGSEKISESGLTCDKPLGMPVLEGNNHKLIVKIPNRGRSPAQSACGGSLEEPSVMNSRASSPALLDKHDQFDRNLKEKSEGNRPNAISDVNNESWQSNDFKDVLTGSDEGDGSPATVPDEERSRPGDNTGKMVDVMKAASSSSGNEQKLGKKRDASFSSINALIESCVKYSEAKALAVGDDAGMNLLASVAASEMSKSGMGSPTHSPHRNTPAMDHSFIVNDVRVKFCPDDLGQGCGRSIDRADDLEKQHAGDPCLESNGNSRELSAPASDAAPSVSTRENNLGDEEGKETRERNTGAGVDVDGNPESKPKISGCLLTEDKVSDSSVEIEAKGAEGSPSHPSIEIDSEKKKELKEGLNNGVQVEPSPAIMCSESVKKTDEILLPPGFVKDTVSGNADEVKVENADEPDSRSNNHKEKQKNDWDGNSSAIHEKQVVATMGSTVIDHKTEHVEDNSEDKKVHNLNCGEPASSKASPALPVQSAEQHVTSRGSKLTGPDVDEAEESTSTTADACFPAGGVSDMDAKVEFDLNEGFNGDDGKYGESSNSMIPGCSSTIQLINPLPLAVSSVSSALPASITVAAAAKGPFVPPEDLLRSKGALGWKGSAATSAFRPAEPRKVLEMPLSMNNVSLSDANVSKHNRPPLDIDLNVPDERILEDMGSRSSAQDVVTLSGRANNRDLECESMGSAPSRCFGGLDLDLNRVEEPIDVSNLTTNNGRRPDVQVQSVKSMSGGFFNAEVSVRRDFDLNDGPADEVSAEPSIFSQHTRTNMPSQPPVSTLRANNTEPGNFSSWFPTGNTYSAITIPPILADRGEQPFPIVATGGPQRMLGPPTGATPFSPDMYRGPLLSSSPAVPFPSTPFQYPVFPFGTSFALPSATFSGGPTTYLDTSSGGRLCFPGVNSQLLGPAGAVQSHYPRPYVVSLQDGSNSVVADTSRKWGRQGLDLNAGPGGPDIEGRDETSPLAPRQLSVAGSQALAEEQARMYQVAGGILKRKEPEGGWDGYKQSSWQ